MKAVVYRTYGSPDVLEYIDTEKPTAADDQVLIKVCAAAVNPLDWHLMRGDPYLVRAMNGLRAPKDIRLGRDLAGVVEAVGTNVTQFAPGDEVFGTADGALAEYACASEKEIAQKPSNLTFEQAAAVPIAALTALQALRNKGHAHAGQKILINGAAGGVGTFAVQIAKAFGAEVTGVCSTRNVELVRSIGADNVIDYTNEDLTKNGKRYDVIFDCIGNHSLSALRRVLDPKGTFIPIGGPVDPWMIGFFGGTISSLVSSLFTTQTLVAFFLAKINGEDLGVLRELIEAGKVTPVIDKRYPLGDVADAIRHLETGHARGKVVITSEK